MLKNFRWYREQGWSEINAEQYAAVWQQWGGSVATHPDVIQKLSDLVAEPVRYLAWFEQGQLVAAIATWGKYFALSKAYLKKHNKRHFFDLGNAEIIFPQAPNTRIQLRHQAQYISELHQGRVTTLKEQKQGLALAREPEEYSRKFRYNQRREQRILEENGGQILPIQSLSAQEKADLYTLLFEKRWGFEVPAKAYLAEVFQRLGDYMVGSYILIDQQPAAIQILYRVESPAWVSVEYINGGVDPAFNALSPGSVLSFVNTQAAWEDARQQGKTLRYSFGRADREYKDRWCNRVPCFEV